MTQSRNDHDQILDRAISQIAGSEPDPSLSATAADRVWSRIAGESAAALGAAEVGEINSCDDYQALIPAYLEEVLPPARKMLLEEHTRECVPCRRALKAARTGEAISAPSPVPSAAPGPRRSGGSGLGWLAMAAALVLGLGMAYFLAGELGGSSELAAVHDVDGQLYRVARSAQKPMIEGDALREGEVVRTGREAGAVLRLEDGSLVEMRERSELAIEESRKGTTVRLERGSVIVQAAEQRQRHLFVATEDCLISVTGTIFSVDHGTKGSRVAVIEGEVHVNFDGTETVLEPGGQVSTHASLDSVPLEKAFGWSRDADQYLELMAELTDLRREIRQSLARPGLRYSSRLLDLMPEETAFYLALPNLGETVSETHRLLQERLEQSEVLSEWMQAEGSAGFQTEVEAMVAEISTFSEFLGDEMAVGGMLAAAGLEGPLVLADLEDGPGLRAFVESHLEDADVSTFDSPVFFVEDPAQIPAGEGMYLWLRGDLLVVTPKPKILRQVASTLEGAANPFLDTPFYASIEDLYAQGAEIMMAVDVERLVAEALASEEEPEQAAGLAARLGVDRARHLLAQQRTFDDRAEYGLALTFSEERRGVASWLAEPAPMGSLEFVSPDASLAASFVVKDPVLLFDDLQAIQGDEEGASGFLDLFDQHGLDFREDLLATLGGELSIAVDGPLLPKPAWKLVVEVYDQARFQWVVEQGLGEINRHLATEGEDALELTREEVGSRTFYSLAHGPVEVHYTFVEGYLVAAPSRALIDRALRYRDSGFSLTDSSRFRALLPPGESNNFSGLLYQDLSEVMQTVAKGLVPGEQLTPEQQESLERLRQSMGPSLAYAHGESDRIQIAATSSSDLLSSLLLRLFGVEDPLGLDQLLGEVIRNL